MNPEWSVEKKLDEDQREKLSQKTVEDGTDKARIDISVEKWKRN